MRTDGRSAGGCGESAGEAPTLASVLVALKTFPELDRTETQKSVPELTYVALDVVGDFLYAGRPAG